jgi:hypothetical protein
MRTHFVQGNSRWWTWGFSLAVVMGLATPAPAQDGFRSDSRSIRRNVPNLSESTAILESAVRNLYTTITPGNDTLPNELLAYADLRVLRLYTGALEMAGWSLEQAMNDYYRYMDAGAYRGGRSRISDQNALIAHDRYHAYRETVRSLLLRVRTTAVSVEHQVSFCDPQINREWRNEVIPALRDTIAATEPLFEEEHAYQRYGIPGQTSSRVIPTAGSGIPNNAVDVGRQPTFQPFEGQGRGQGRFFEIRAYGGSVRVRSIRFRNHENAFGVLGTSTIKDINVNQTADPGQPLYIPCNRNRWVDISELEVQWENVERGRKAFATIELVESAPGTR